jgi:hypothetical protein
VHSVAYLQQVLKARNGELVELREQMKSNAVDLKTASKPDTNIWLLTFQQALKARDVELMGLQNENEQLKSAAVHLEEVLPFFLSLAVARASPRN